MKPDFHLIISDDSPWKFKNQVSTYIKSQILQMQRQTVSKEIANQKIQEK